MNYNLETDIRKAQKGLDDLGRKVFPAALAAAINKTERFARIAASKEIRKEYNIKAADVKKTISFKRASKNRLRAEFASKGTRISLAKFGARQTKKGVTVKVKKTGGRKLIKAAFLSTMPSGHKGVFHRMKDWKKKEISGKKSRTGSKVYHGLRIVERTTVSVSQMLKSAKVRSVIRRTIRDRFPEQLANQIKFRVGRLKR